MRTDSLVLRSRLGVLRAPCATRKTLIQWLGGQTYENWSGIEANQMEVSAFGQFPGSIRRTWASSSGSGGHPGLRIHRCGDDVRALQLRRIEPRTVRQRHLRFSRIFLRLESHVRGLRQLGAHRVERLSDRKWRLYGHQALRPGQSGLDLGVPGKHVCGQNYQYRATIFGQRLENKSFPRMTGAENWLPIPGWEGFYEVSDMGRVRSVDRMVANAVSTYLRRGCVLRANSTQGGYLTVMLWRNSQSQRFTIHKLVLTTFVGPRPLGYEGCHGPGGQRDNSLANLRWDTVSANKLDTVRAGTHAESRKTHCIRGHLLVEPNLLASGIVKGIRVCLSCLYARNTVRRKSGDLADLSNQFYQRLGLA